MKLTHRWFSVRPARLARVLRRHALDEDTLHRCRPYRALIAAACSLTSACSRAEAVLLDLVRRVVERPRPACRAAGL